MHGLEFYKKNSPNLCAKGYFFMATLLTKFNKRPFIAHSLMLRFMIRLYFGDMVFVNGFVDCQDSQEVCKFGYQILMNAFL